MRFSLMLTLAALLISSEAIADPAGAVSATIQARRAMAKDKPFASAVPRSKEPSGELIVLRIWPDSIEMRIAIGALQGIVNREKPKLYIGIDKPLRWLEYYGGKTVTKIEPDIYKIFDRYKDQVKGIVVYDTSLDALANVAITYAAIEDLIPADPALAQDLSSRFGWKIVHDVRGKWTTRAQAYQWAYDNLFPKCNKFALTHYNHGYRSKEPDPFGMDSETFKTGFEVDYAVQFHMFTWHIGSDPSKEEMQLAEKILQSVPFHTPIFGRSATQDTFAEPAFVSFVAKFADLHIPAGMSNTSVLSGAQLPAELLKQKEFPVRDQGQDKVYITFNISESDNLEHVIGGGPPWHRTGMETDDPYRIWWCDPWRGRVPIGWAVGPLLCELAPTTLAHFMTTSTENDYFLASLGGLCLSSPPDYGSAYPGIQDELLDEYVKMTGQYMNRLGWTQVSPVGPPAVLRHFTKNIPNLGGILEGYGPHKGMSLEKANYILDGVPVFHAVVDGTVGTSRDKPISVLNEAKAKSLAEMIKAVKVDKRPAFVHVWVVGWDWGPTTLKMAADKLPPEYAVVRPDELAALYKKYSGSKAALKSTQPKATAAGAVTETPNGDSGLVIDTGRIRAEIGWGSAPQAPIKRVMGVDGKWRGTGRLSLYNPEGIQPKQFVSKKTKDTPEQKDYRLSYSYGEEGSFAVTVTALAGRPYLIVKEESAGCDLPSWGIDPYVDFQPDMLYTDIGERPMECKSMKSMGALPWYKWMLAGKQNGPERDMIGIFVLSQLDWTGSESLFWQRPQDAFWEFYCSRTGAREFAVGAIDKNDAGAPERIWNELNTRRD